MDGWFLLPAEGAVACSSAYKTQIQRKREKKLLLWLNVEFLHVVIIAYLTLMGVIHISTASASQLHAPKPFQERACVVCRPIRRELKHQLADVTCNQG